MRNRKAVVVAWSAMIALLAVGATLAHADKGGNGKGKGNPMDIGAIHNIMATFGNPGIGNGLSGGNSGRSSQVFSPTGGMSGSSNGGGTSGSSNGGGMSGSSNAGGNGRPDNAALGSKQGKDVKDFKDVKDVKEPRTKDTKDVRVADAQDLQGEKDKELVTVAVAVSDKSSDQGSGKSSDESSGKPREAAASEPVRSESAAASESRSARPAARIASCT